MEQSWLRNAAATGTPSYLYNLAALRSRVGEMRNAFESKELQLLFATMANPSEAILATLASMGVGACVNSTLHLEKAIAAEIPTKAIQFTSTGLSLEDLTEVKRRQVTVNLDSARQLHRWFAEVGGAEAGVRLNAAALVNAPRGAGDRIGIEPGDLAAVQRAANSIGGRIVGVHVYVGTNFQSPEKMFPVLEAFFDAAKQVEALRYVNIGGGVGVDYRRNGTTFDLKAFGSRIDQLHEELQRRLGRPLQLFFEPGRALAAPAGWFICRVTDVKVLRGCKYVAVDASVAQFPRPLHHPDETHVVHCLGSNKMIRETKMTQTIVVGRTTFSRDVLAQASLPDDVDVDDILIFEDAGAYCSSMASRFLGQLEPNVLTVG